jgi:hypothetical protein
MPGLSAENGLEFTAQPLEKTIMTDTNQPGADPHHGSYPPPAPYEAAPYGRVAETKSPLIALICGIASFVVGGPFAAIPAIIFGVKGRREAREGRTPNGGMATAGMWLGIANLSLVGLVVVLAIVGLVSYQVA